MALNVGAALQNAMAGPQALGLALGQALQQAAAQGPPVVVQSALGMASAFKTAQEELNALRAALHSFGGAASRWDQYAAGMAAISKEMTKLRDAAHWKDLVAQQGLFGASMTYAAEKTTAMRQGLDSVGAAFSGIRDAIQASGLPSLGDVAAAVAKGAPAVFERWTRAVNDLTGSIGQALAPVLIRATAAVRGLADWVASMDPSTRNLIVVITAAGVAAVTAAGLIIGGITAVTAAMAALNVTTAGVPILIGLVVTGAAALAGALAMAGTSTEGFAGSWNAVLAAVSPVVNILTSLGGLFMSFASGVMQVYAVVGSALLPLLDAVGTALSEMGAALGQTGSLFEMLGMAVGVLAGVALAPALAAFAAIAGAVWLVATAVKGLIALFQGLMALLQGKSFLEAANASLTASAEQAKKTGQVVEGSSWGRGGFQPVIEDILATRDRMFQASLAESVGQKDPMDQANQHLGSISASADQSKGILDEIKRYLTGAPKVVP